MELKINNNNPKNDLFSFAEYIAKQFPIVFDKLLQTEKIELFNQFLRGYLQDNADYQSTQRNAITARELLKIAENNVIVKRYSGYIILKIDENICIPNTSIKIEPLCRLLNYGNMSLPPYPIFDMTFEYIRNRVNALYILYNKNIR